MANLDLVTFEDIYLAALRRVKGDPDDVETLERVKEIINTHYRYICSRKKWKFLRFSRSFKLTKKYSTGTVSIANGSRSVTGVGTGWIAKQKNWWLKFDGLDTSYRVVSVISATKLLIASELTEVSIVNGTYFLYQSDVPLFPNVEDIDDVRLDGQRRSIRPEGPAIINQLRQSYPSRTGRPARYTIEGSATYHGPLLKDFILGYDFMSGATVKTVSWFPHIPDQDYTIQMAFKIKLDPLILPSQQPLIPIQHRIVLLYFTLADLYASSDNKMASYYETLGKDVFKDMIAHYLDTDDIIRLQPRSGRDFSHSYLMRYSSTYFDTEG